MTRLQAPLNQHLYGILHPSSCQHMAHHCSKSCTDFSMTPDLLMSFYCGHWSHHDPLQRVSGLRNSKNLGVASILQSLSAKESGWWRGFINVWQCFLLFPLSLDMVAWLGCWKPRIPQSISKIFEDRTASWSNVCVKTCIPNSCYNLSSTVWFPWCYILH